MIHEYALDPKVICDKQSARYFFDACKPETGRLISQFPKRWKKLVFEHCQSVLPQGSTLKYIEEKLVQLDQSLYRAGRGYNADISWLNNAVDSNRDNPFKAIISTASGPLVLCADDVDASDLRWGVKSCYDIRRSAVEIANCCSGLLRLSSEIVFIDPYCKMDSRHSSVLRELLKYAKEGKRPIRVEYHAEKKRENGASADHQEAALRGLNLALPCPFYFIRWNKLPEPPPDARLHARGIVTELAAVDIEGGLDSGNGNTPVKLLDSDTHQRLRRQYTATSTAFEFIDGWCVSNGKTTPIVPQGGRWICK